MYFLLSRNTGALAAILFYILFQSSHSSEITSFCKDLPAGQYCSDDLQGYYDCRRRSPSHSGIYKKCRGKKRCSCQFKKKCTVPISEICQRLVEPLPFVRNFMLTGFAEETRKSVGGVSTTKTIHGNIFKNTDAGKFRLETWIGTSGDPKTYSFEYRIKNNNGDGKFTRYNGTFFKCQKGSVDSIPFFADPLKDYQLLDTTTYPLGKVRETWFKQLGQSSYNKPLSKYTYIVERATDEHGNEVIIPFDETLEQKATDGSEYRIHWRDTFLNIFAFPDEFFVLPEHCRNL